MVRDLRDGQRMRLLAAALAQGVAAAHVDGHSALQVRQAEVDAAVASKGCTQQREQPLVLVDRQQLSVGQGPAFGREIERHETDFRQEGFSHLSSRSYNLTQPPLALASWR